jgi:hypothetical protein
VGLASASPGYPHSDWGVEASSRGAEVMRRGWRWNGAGWVSMFPQAASPQATSCIGCTHVTLRTHGLATSGKEGPRSLPRCPESNPSDSFVFSADNSTSCDMRSRILLERVKPPNPLFSPENFPRVRNADLWGSLGKTHDRSPGAVRPVVAVDLPSVWLSSTMVYYAQDVP